MKETQTNMKFTHCAARVSWLISVFFSALLLVNCAWAKTVGKLPGVFSVNGNGGANYSVPINVPPGTKGIEPELALSYNSQSKNGLLGVGWQLKGLHAIARCVQTREQDGEDFIPGIHFNYEDRFCLDGQRLMVTAGQYGHDHASYRKERDDWSQVESYGTCGQGPCHFRVIDKNNISYEFGNSADSRIEAKARPEVAVWYINKITDQHGNYLTYTYIEDRINGESRISVIRYTANDNAGVQANKRVDFVYEDRADTSFHYQHGQKYNNTKRLWQIITEIDGSIEKTYTLVYEYGATTRLSRLNSIKVCASRTSCLPATKFRYTDNALNNISLLHGAKPLGDWEDRGSARERKYLVFDADMDGLNDIMSIAKGHNGISGAATTFWKNNGNGFTDTGDRNIGGWSDVTAYDARQYLPMDVNADGANDIVEIYKGEGTESAYASVWYNGGDGTFSLPARCPFGQNIGNWSNANGPDPHRYLVMDVNSDKRPDIVDIYRCRGRRTCATSLLNNVEEFNFCFLPFMPSSLFSSFSESVSEIGGWTDVNAGDARRYLPIDVNGDGVPDLVEIWKNKSNAWATVWLGDGKGSFSTPNIKGQWIGGWEDVNSANQHHYIPMNLNGDSLLDIVEIWRNGDLGAYAALWINRGDNTFEKHQGDTVNIGGWSAVNGPHARRYLTADINGNGRDDLIEIWHHGNTNATHATIWLNNNRGFDLFNWLNNNRGFDLFNPGGTHIGGWTDINSPDARRYSLMDVNGDGISEILEIYKVNNNHTNASVWSFRNTVPDLLSSVTDGLGKLITISYKPITDHSVYKRDVDLSISSEKYKKNWINTIEPLWVVSGHTVATTTFAGACDLTNDCYRYSHHYENGIIDKGRGWLGFERSILKDYQHNTKTITTHHLRFPLTGLIQQVEVQDITDSTKILGKEEYRYSDCAGGENRCADLPSGVHRAYLDQTLKHHYTEGTLNYTLQTRFDYGNPQLSNGQPIRIHYDGDIQTVENDDAYTICIQYMSATDMQWWKRSYAEYKKVTAPDNSCVNTAVWIPGDDYSLKKYSYEQNEQMNLQKVERYVDQGLANTTSGRFIASGVSHYDQFGNVTSVDHSTGARTEFIYDPTGAYLEKKSLIGEGVTLSTRYEYDRSLGVITKVTGENSQVTLYTYDDWGRETSRSETSPYGLISKTVKVSESYYERSNRAPGWYKIRTLKRESWGDDNTANWLESSSHTDSLSRERSLHTSGFSAMPTVAYRDSYNKKGQVVRRQSNFFEDTQLTCNKLSTDSPVCLAAPPTTHISYDRHGRVTTIDYPLGAKAQYQYNLHDLLITKSVNSPAAVSDNDNAVVSTDVKYDSRGNVIYQRSASGATTHYRYDAAGRLLNITDPLGQTRSFTYNSLGQKLTDTDNETGTTIYQYDEHANLVLQKDAAGRTQTFQYDALGRLSVKSASINGSEHSRVQYEYGTKGYWVNTLGRVIKITTYINGVPTAQKDYDTYTPQGLKSSVFFRFDINGNGRLDLRGRVVEAVAFDYSYNALGQLVAMDNTEWDRIAINRSSVNGKRVVELKYSESISEPITLARFSDYHVNGNPTTTTYLNGVTEHHSYDELGRVTSINIENAATLFDQSYHWNKANRLIGIDNHLDATLSETFEHDHAGRLIKAVGPYGNLSYNFDAAGNIQTSSGSTYSYRAGKAHQLSKVVSASHNDTTYSHDAAGFRVSKKEVSANKHWTYTWDANGNLAQVKLNNTIVNSYVYDENNDRVIKHDYDNGKLVRSSYYIPGLYEIVVNHSNGTRSYTDYFAGVAARTRYASATMASGGHTIENSIAYRAGVMMASVMPTSLDDINTMFIGLSLMISNSDISARAIYIVLWVATVALIISYLFYVLLLSATRDSYLGRLRYQLLIRLVRTGWLSRGTAHKLNNPITRANQGVKLLTVGVVLVCFMGTTVPPAHAALNSGANGNGVPVPGEMLFFHKDYLGSTSLITNEHGNVVSRINYQPFGAIDQAHSSGSDHFRNKFTGKEFDSESHLYYFGHRYYDAQTGRFISPDPAAQYHSPYIYGNDDPFAGTDPDGEMFFSMVILTIAVIGGAYAGGSAVNHEANPAHWNWTSGKTYGGVLGGAVIGAAGGVAGLAVAEAGVGIAAGIAIDAAIAGTESASFTALGGGSASDVGKSFAIGAATGAVFSGAFRGIGAGIGRIARRSTREVAEGVGMVERSSGCHCFIAGTKISAKEGTKNIEDIQVNDLVLSKDEVTGETHFKPVKKLFITQDNAVGKIVLKNERGENETLGVTSDHPFYVVGFGFVNASLLEAGQKIGNAHGDQLTVEKEWSQTDIATTYNFEVEDTHTYFVGESGAWVHNLCDDILDNVAGFLNFADQTNLALASRRAIGNARRNMRLELDTVDARIQSLHEEMRAAKDDLRSYSTLIKNKKNYIASQPTAMPADVMSLNAWKHLHKTAWLKTVVIPDDIAHLTSRKKFLLGP